MSRTIAALCALLCLGFASPLFAPRRVVAVRAQAPIVLDGAFDDPAWQAAPVADQFMQEDPAPGELATLHSSFRVAFDDDALYLAIRMDDPAAAHIAAPLGRRDDENNSDWCFVELDSRRDRRTAYSFGVNPAGMQVDGMFVNDTEYDATWNAVWEAATRRDATGWTAEYRIPFAALAFQPPDDGAAMRWGINVYRSNPHTGEVSNWSPRTPEVGGVVSLFNELEIASAPRVRRIELTPYASFAVERSAAHARELTPRAGLDVNLGITPSIGLVATVLPDFGQVEADPTQLNLTELELFQEERRPFFTEGIDAFKFDTALNLTSRDIAFGDEAALYSRRIGRAPEGDLPSAARAPIATDILGAAKLFGRTASGWRAGVLAAVTDGAHASTPTGDVAIAAPSQAAIVRVVREADNGNLAAGAFASGLHRMLDAPLDAQLTRDAGALGIDGRARWDGYEARAWALATTQRGSRDAIDRLASAPWHNLDRPDAPRLHLDADATHLDGIAGEARVARISGALQGNLAARAISPGFDVNALGFQRNSDWMLVAGQWAYSQYPRDSWVRHWQVGSDNAGLGWSWGGERRAAVVDAYATLGLPSYWGGTVTAQHEAAVRSMEWLRGGPALVLPPRELAKLSIHSDSRRPTVATVDALGSIEPGSGSRALSIEPSVTVRISDNVAGVLGASYHEQVVGWQYVAGPGDGAMAAPADTYVVARLRQRTLALSLKADIALSPRFIIQLYAQPFVTLGRYGRYAQVGDPHADDVDARVRAFAPSELASDGELLRFMPADRAAFALQRPDGSERTLIASAIARWELAPGSFLTAVWSHRGDGGALTRAARLGDELGDVLHERGIDVFLVKLGWRFAP